MSYGLDLSSGPVELTPGLPFTDTGDIQRPGNWIELSSPQARTAAGVRPITEPGAPPDGQRVASLTLQKVGAAITRVATYEPIPLAGLKAAKRALVDPEYQRRMAVGFPWTFSGVAETLQCANNDDRTNWLTLKDGCNDAKDAGYGAAPVSPPIRCTSNAQYTPTIDETLLILAGLRGWAGSMLAASWAHKNAIDAATTKAQLDAIDVTAGWPT